MTFPFLRIDSQGQNLTTFVFKIQHIFWSWDLRNCNTNKLLRTLRHSTETSKSYCPPQFLIEFWDNCFNIFIVFSSIEFVLSLVSQNPLRFHSPTRFQGAKKSHKSIKSHLTQRFAIQQKLTSLEHKRLSNMHAKSSPNRAQLYQNIRSNASE